MEQLIIFIKAPRSGLVKTRLAQSIGPDAACAAYRQLAEKIFVQLTSLRNVELRFTPDDAAIEIEPWLRPAWRSHPQGPGDLGRRLEVAFEDHFARGARRVVIIGSDCPAVSELDIQAAWTGLETNDVVLGPAHDGGYWLIGLRQPQPLLFRDIPWSTETVLTHTLQRAQTANLKTHLLRELMDIDTVADWQTLKLSSAS